MADFLAEAMVVHPNARIAAGEAYKAYREWADQRGLTGRDILTLTTFGRRMASRFKKERMGNGHGYVGVGLGSSVGLSGSPPIFRFFFRK